LTSDDYVVTDVNEPELTEQSNPTEQPSRMGGPATIALILINVFAFGCQLYVQQFHPRFPMDDYFALSLDGLRHHYFWQLLTFQFMHGGFLHIFLNLWALFVFGRVIEYTLGKRRMLQLYLFSGAMGGLVQMLGAWLLPSLFGDAGVVGASAGVFGLMAAFAVLYPHQELYLLLLLIIPIRMRAFTLIWFSAIFSVFGILLPWIGPHLPRILHLDALMGNWAHAAHLGGIITGAWFTRQLLQTRRRVPPVIQPPSVKSSLNIHPASD
jgi:membrane associated rhomboid family serine protease